MILYSTDCSKCKIIETLLKANRDEFTVCKDLKKIIDAGFREVPVLELIDGTMLPYNLAIQHLTQARGIY